MLTQDEIPTILAKITGSYVFAQPASVEQDIPVANVPDEIAAFLSRNIFPLSEEALNTINRALADIRQRIGHLHLELKEENYAIFLNWVRQQLGYQTDASADSSSQSATN